MSDYARTAKRDTHLEGKSGHTMCGEKAYPDTLVKSVKDTTCYYCKQAWEKKHSKSASYDRTARVTSPEKLLKDMKDGVELLLETRVAIRKLHENLSEVSNDATGLTFTDNYHDADIDRVSKLLYEFDFSFGNAISGIEGLSRKLKAKIK